MWRYNRAFLIFFSFTVAFSTLTAEPFSYWLSKASAIDPQAANVLEQFEEASLYVNDRTLSQTERDKIRGAIAEKFVKSELASTLWPKIQTSTNPRAVEFFLYTLSSLLIDADPREYLTKNTRELIVKVAYKYLGDASGDPLERLYAAEIVGSIKDKWVDGYKMQVGSIEKAYPAALEHQLNTFMRIEYVDESLHAASQMIRSRTFAEPLLRFSMVLVQGRWLTASDAAKFELIEALTFLSTNESSELHKLAAPESKLDPISAQEQLTAFSTVSHFKAAMKVLVEQEPNHLNKLLMQGLVDIQTEDCKMYQQILARLGG